MPNGTHKWQVGDSRQQNGRWKIEWYKEKDELVSYKREIGLGGTLEKSDIMPIINRIWDKSFANKEGNLKAMGWNPLNYKLLTDREILVSCVDYQIDVDHGEMYKCYIDRNYCGRRE